LIASVNDDYGDGKISKDFFTHIITPEQKKVADRHGKIILKRSALMRIINLRSTSWEINSGSSGAHEAVGPSIAVTRQWVTGHYEEAEAAFSKSIKKRYQLIAPS
jgi:hypothetical protein